MATALMSSNWTERAGGIKVGSTRDGSVVDLHVLKHKDIDAAIMTYGARLTSLRTPDRYGKMEDVILKYSVLDSYLVDRPCYLGRSSDSMQIALRQVGSLYAIATTRLSLMIAVMRSMAEKSDSTSNSGLRDHCAPELS
jgi:Aldose 1-epimerase